MLITVRHTEIPALTTFARRFLTSDEENRALGIDYMLYELLDAIADGLVSIFWVGFQATWTTLNFESLTRLNVTMTFLKVFTT